MVKVKTRWWIALFALVMVLAVAVGMISLPPREPVYQGKPVSRDHRNSSRLQRGLRVNSVQSRGGLQPYCRIRIMQPLHQGRGHHRGLLRVISQRDGRVVPQRPIRSAGPERPEKRGQQLGLFPRRQTIQPRALVFGRGEKRDRQRAHRGILVIKLGGHCRRSRFGVGSQTGKEINQAHAPGAGGVAAGCRQPAQQTGGQPVQVPIQAAVGALQRAVGSGQTPNQDLHASHAELAPLLDLRVIVVGEVRDPIAFRFAVKDWVPGLQDQPGQADQEGEDEQPPTGQKDASPAQHAWKYARLATRRKPAPSKRRRGGPACRRMRIARDTRERVREATPAAKDGLPIWRPGRGAAGKTLALRWIFERIRLRRPYYSI
jgi:hypothetical protein